MKRKNECKDVYLKHVHSNRFVYGYPKSIDAGGYCYHRGFVQENRGRAYKYSFYQRKEPAGHKGYACRKRSAYRKNNRK